MLRVHNPSWVKSNTNRHANRWFWSRAKKASQLYTKDFCQKWCDLVQAVLSCCWSTNTRTNIYKSDFYRLLTKSIKIVDAHPKTKCKTAGWPILPQWWNYQIRFQRMQFQAYDPDCFFSSTTIYFLYCQPFEHTLSMILIR